MKVWKDFVSLLCTMLPFGLSNAPFIFFKVVRPLVKYWSYAVNEGGYLGHSRR